MELVADFGVETGELAALFGPSGAGKTTVLRLIAGLDAPDSGRIEVGGEVWFDAARGINLPPQRRRVGFVFQDYALFPHLTVRGNLDFARDGEDGDAQVASLLDLMNLRPLEGRMPDTLSGGEKQRVALARALVRRPRILLLDEPFAALDLDMRLRLQGEVAEVQRRLGVATLLVSHDLAEVFRLCRTVHRLEDGRLVRSGPPAAVFGGARLSGKFRVTGTLLDKRPSDVVVILSVLVGGDIVKVTCLPEEAATLAVGDRLLVASKAWNPLITKLG